MLKKSSTFSPSSWTMQYGSKITEMCWRSCRIFNSHRIIAVTQKNTQLFVFAVLFLQEVLAVRHPPDEVPSRTGYQTGRQCQSLALGRLLPPVDEPGEGKKTLHQCVLLMALFCQRPEVRHQTRSEAHTLFTSTSDFTAAGDQSTHMYVIRLYLSFNYPLHDGG